MTILHSVLYCLCSPRQMLYILIIAMRIAKRRRKKPFLFSYVWGWFLWFTWFWPEKGLVWLNRESQTWVLLTHREMFPSGR